MPLRGKQPQERVCVANWRRSLCAAKRNPRLVGYTPPRPPKRKSEGAVATRTQYYCSRLTPPPLPSLLSRVFPRTPAAINFLSLCRGRACPARNLSKNPFHGQSVGEGFIPPAHLPIATHHTKKDAQPLRSCVLYFYASFFMALLIGPLTAISTAASAKLTTRYTGNIPVSGRSNRAATRKNTSVSST